ncbi:hypothetical protein [Paraburkholderia dilworthii]|uniref:Uncharacterized protein n=1 Tax=Paraburkholderia dilworthii TaxID=948106 RepID=A0ABW9DA57_9BURK
MTVNPPRLSLSAELIHSAAFRHLRAIRLALCALHTAARRQTANHRPRLSLHLKPHRHAVFVRLGVRADSLIRIVVRFA